MDFFLEHGLLFEIVNNLALRVRAEFNWLIVVLEHHLVNNLLDTFLQKGLDFVFFAQKVEVEAVDLLVPLAILEFGSHVSGVDAFLELRGEVIDGQSFDISDSVKSQILGGMLNRGGFFLRVVLFLSDGDFTVQLKIT